MAVLPVHAGGQSPVFFTVHSHQVLSNCVHLLGVSILSFCLAHRVPSLSSWSAWINLTWGRLCVLLVFFDSWLFIFFTGVLVNGVGLSFSHSTCAIAIYACIGFYGLSKVLIYGFLVEKMYIVWSGGNQIPRSKSRAYQICAIVLLGYVVVLALMVLGQNSHIRSDGICIIGLKNYATIPLISYDLSLNVFLTAMFVYPLRQSNVMSHRLRKVTTRTLYGACISLTISAANVIVLLALKGEEYGWACLASCVTDVALNAMAVSWVTATSYSRQNVTVDRYSLPTMDVGPLMAIQTNCEMGKERDPRASTTMQAATFPSPMLDSIYDYIPRDQRSDAGAVDGAPSKGWFRRFRDRLRFPRDPTVCRTLVSGTMLDDVTQVASLRLPGKVNASNSLTEKPCEQFPVSAASVSLNATHGCRGS